MVTFLQDASDGGARLLTDCEAIEILHSAGQAHGVRAALRTDSGPRQVVVDAPIIVVASGALSSPLLLQRSKLGGACVGQNLHVHPTYFMSGVFDEQVHGWAGQILTSVCDEFSHVEGNHGFMIEAAPMSVGSWAAMTPWTDGEQHKREQARLGHVSGVWGFVRDHGSGTVTGGTDGSPLVSWSLEDPVDLAVVRRCHVELARVLHASGATEIFTFLKEDMRWREEEDFEAFLGQLQSLKPEDLMTLSAHQSGTCATGASPDSSVVDGRGQLHDAQGVYIVDASALPTAPGVNPMVSIEAFASKTAVHIIDDWKSRRTAV